MMYGFFLTHQTWMCHHTCTHMQTTYMCLVKLYFHTQLESVPITYYTWLVVSTPLKHINQLGSLFPIYGKITNVPNHQPDIRYTQISLASPGISQSLKLHGQRFGPRLLSSQPLGADRMREAGTTLATSQQQVSLVGKVPKGVVFGARGKGGLKHPRQGWLVGISWSGIYGCENG